MIRLAEVIDAFAADFLKEYRGHLTPDHLRALNSFRHCRSEVSPKMQAQCTECPQQLLVPHSCGHRHCPHCQHHESQIWLERQLKRQVPAEYFLLTFTLPAEFRGLAQAHQVVVYDLLMTCAWQTVRTFSLNDRQLQGIPGAIAVLHTNTRRLEYHPHVHLVVPAAAINGKEKRWRKKRCANRRYLFSYKALRKVFRAKMLAGFAAADLRLPSRHPHEWVVDCKAVGNGDKALVYLGRYLYRGVIQEKDILAYENGQVRFRYRDAKTKRIEVRSVSGADFLWLVLQHVLPRGFRRARNFGFLHHNSQRLIALLQVLLRFVPPVVPARERPSIRCPCCGAVMVIVKRRLRPVFSGPEPVPVALGGTL